MRFDFDAIRDHSGDTLPFPSVLRRPDYRSSGHKRLMRRVSIRVPSLRTPVKKVPPARPRRSDPKASGVFDRDRLQARDSAVPTAVRAASGGIPVPFRVATRILHAIGIERNLSADHRLNVQPGPLPARWAQITVLVSYFAQSHWSCFGRAHLPFFRAGILHSNSMCRESVSGRRRAAARS
jgi:hypothetical protein